jgi:hypothetical protein
MCVVLFGWSIKRFTLKNELLPGFSIKEKSKIENLNFEILKTVRIISKFLINEAKRAQIFAKLKNNIIVTSKELLQFQCKSKILLLRWKTFAFPKKLNEKK